MSHDLLFIDDDPVFLKRCKDIFADSPYQLHFTPSAEQGLSLIQDGLDPVVVIAGQSMTEMDCPTFFMQVHESKPVTQLIMVAGVCDSLLVSKAVNTTGLFRYYTKDVEENELKKGVIAAVSHCLHRRESLRAAKSIVGVKAGLEDLTSHLEKAVEYHTRKLQKSNDENIQLTHTLKRTVLELEGRDRVLRHLLTIHTLEDTLQTILEVINDVLSMSCGIIHIKDEKGGLQQVCMFPKDHPQAHAGKPSQLIQDAVTSGRMEILNEPELSYTAMVVPICKGETVLGGIEIVWENEAGQGGLSEEELIANAQSIYNFTVHAAIALSDHNISSDKSSWSKTLDDVLMDFLE